MRAASRATLSAGISPGTCTALAYFPWFGAAVMASRRTQANPPADFHQADAAAGTQHAVVFGESAIHVADVAQRVTPRDEIDMRVRQRDRLGIAFDGFDRDLPA